MVSKGTQRRLAVFGLAFTALASGLIVEGSAWAFPPSHAVYSFNYKMVATSRITKLKQTITPWAGTFKGGIDLVTGQLKGSMKLPAVTFSNPSAGLASATATIVQAKPFTGKVNLKNLNTSTTTTFVIQIVSTYASGAHTARVTASSALPITLPTIPGVTLPPVTLPGLTLPGTPAPGSGSAANLVGNACQSVAGITMTLRGVTHMSSTSKLAGTFTIPKFKGCGAATGLLNSSLSGAGNTFAAIVSPASSTPPGLTLPSLPITLPTLPGGVTLPTLPVTLPTLPVTLPTLPGVTLPTLPVTVPTLPAVTLPTLPGATVPTLPVTVPTLPGVTLPTVPG